MLVDIDTFNNYSGNYEDSEAAVELKLRIVQSAQELVSEYLRYDPEEFFETVPSLIIMTILRISTLMLMEGGENIGVSGKSFADNSRTFVSYTNYMKYLNPIQTFRKTEF